MAAGLFLTGCTDDIMENGGGGEADLEPGMKVLFAAGSEHMDQTRAGNISYMPNHVRFSAMMMIKSTKDEDYRYEHPFFANMVVDNQNAGNSLYYQDSYIAPVDEKKDHYNNDNDASIFYWQNRLSHGFIGYIDDYNKALPWAKHQADNSQYPDAGEYKPVKLDQWNTSAPGLKDDATGEIYYDKVDKNKDLPFLYTMEKSGRILRWQQYVAYDLTNKESLITKMSQQQDPLIAYEEKVPEGSSAEKNRVYLTFRHQFAQVQVNLKGSEESAPLTVDQIDSVALQGVAETAYIFPYPEYGVVDGSMEIIRQGNSHKDLLREAYAVPLTLAQMNANPPAGSTFYLFEMEPGTQATGYLKGFEAIAYGNLANLRIVWHENDTEGNPDIYHRVTFPITDDRFKTLQSGKRYIFNLEMRRGTLAAIMAEIVDWIPYNIVYEEKGTIVK